MRRSEFKMDDVCPLVHWITTRTIPEHVMARCRVLIHHMFPAEKIVQDGICSNELTRDALYQDAVDEWLNHILVWSDAQKHISSDTMVGVIMLSRACSDNMFMHEKRAVFEQVSNQETFELKSGAPWALVRQNSLSTTARMQNQNAMGVSQVETQGFTQNDWLRLFFGESEEMQIKGRFALTHFDAMMLSSIIGSTPFPSGDSSTPFFVEHKEYNSLILGHFLVGLCIYLTVPDASLLRF